jgi:hypothetical protein
MCRLDSFLKDEQTEAPLDLDRSASVACGLGALREVAGRDSTGANGE